MRHRWFMASCIVILFMGLAHLLAVNASPQPEPKSADEKTMLELMNRVDMELPLAKRTKAQVMTGFGWFFTLASVTMAGAGLRIAKQPGARRVAEIYALGLAAMLVNSIVHWFIIPTSFLAIALVLCGISLIPQRAREVPA